MSFTHCFTFINVVYRQSVVLSVFHEQVSIIVEIFPVPRFSTLFLSYKLDWEVSYFFQRRTSRRYNKPGTAQVGAHSMLKRIKFPKYASDTFVNGLSTLQSRNVPEGITHKT